MGCLKIHHSTEGVGVHREKIVTTNDVRCAPQRSAMTIAVNNTKNVLKNQPFRYINQNNLRDACKKLFWGIQFSGPTHNKSPVFKIGRNMCRDRLEEQLKSLKPSSCVSKTRGNRTKRVCVRATPTFNWGFF
jgi:hypothetical protein